MKHWAIVALIVVTIFVVVALSRAGALLVDMHDDLAFLAGIGSYLLIPVVAVIVAGMIGKYLKSL